MKGGLCMLSTLNWNHPNEKLLRTRKSVDTSFEAPPAPQPPKGGHWEGPVHTTFGDKDCPNVGCHGGSAAPLTFKECAALCDGLPGCDAMNFSPMNASGAGGCCLRACPAGYGPPREPAGACCAYWRDDNTTRATTIATDGLQ